MSPLIQITKSDGSRQIFDEEKLVNSLHRVGANKDVIDNVVEEIEREMWDGMPTTDIYTRAFALLKKHSKHVAVKYSIRRSLIELGPEGFAFEKFVGRIFGLWGYEYVNDQTLIGTCVEHEVDVVAWKGDTLAMTEVKFHNEFGLKSDLKVALYVKARFDDLSDSVYNYGGKERKLTERFLFTNTKFTESAVRYGECKDMKMIGWNYPIHGNIHELIEKNGLHPITCSTLLSHEEKRNLISGGTIMCKEVISEPGRLEKIGVKPDRNEEILNECKLIIEKAK
jgi:hypothetical protein